MKAISMARKTCCGLAAKQPLPYWSFLRAGCADVTTKALADESLQKAAICATYHNVCYIRPRSTLPLVLLELLRRPETRAKAGACIAYIVIPCQTRRCLHHQAEPRGGCLAVLATPRTSMNKPTCCAELKDDPMARVHSSHPGGCNTKIRREVSCRGQSQ